MNNVWSFITNQNFYTCKAFLKSSMKSKFKLKFSFFDYKMFPVDPSGM